MDDLTKFIKPLSKQTSWADAVDDDSSDDGKNNSDSDDDILYRRKKTQSKIFSLLIVYLFSFYISFQVIFHDVTSLKREWWTRAAGCCEGCITAS